MPRFALFFLALALLAAGCAAHVPMAPTLADHQAKAFQPTQETAAIYVVRPGKPIASSVLFQVAVNGQVLGHLATATYLWVPVAPGTHTVVASSNENSVRETVTVQPGQAVYLALLPRMGMTTTRVASKVLEPRDGHTIVANSRLAQRLDQ